MTTKTKKESLNAVLVRLGACGDAQEWAKGKSLDRAWKTCKRSDWMIWLLARTTVDEDDSRFRLMACDFAEAVLHLVPKGEDRPRKAIEAARAYLAETITREELAVAADASRAAAADASRAAAGGAAWAAAWTASKAAARGASWTAAWTAARDAAWAAAWTAAKAAARDATWTASKAASKAAARDAAWAVAWDASKAAARGAQCKIIRKYFRTCPQIKG